MDSAPLPIDWYTSPDAFAHERRTLFAREWQMIARAAQLAEPGAYVCANLAGWPVFVMRDAAGALGAFRNACRHQKLPVLENGAGTSKLLRCRYHGWTYDFAGAFVGAPPMVAPPDPAAPEHHLQRFAVAEWRGLVFINPDATAASPAAVLDAIVPLERARLDERTFGGEIVTDLACNWKVAVNRYLSVDAEIFWVFPCLVVAPQGSAAIIHQIVPRTHLRSRIVSHVYAAAGGDAAALVEGAGQQAAAAKVECEAVQARYQSGAAPPPGPALAVFHERLRAAHTETPHA